MTQLASSYVPSLGTAATRNSDVLPFPFPARPQAMTVYVWFVEMGTIVSPVSGQPTRRVIHIGKSDNTSPRLGINRDDTGNYGIFTNNGTGESDRTSVLSAAPSVGDVVELRGILNADGSIQLGQSVNGATETTSTTSAAAALPTAWSDVVLWLNSVGTTSEGFNAFRNVKIHRGVQSLTTMRRLAGVI